MRNKIKLFLLDVNKPVTVNQVKEHIHAEGCKNSYDTEQILDDLRVLLASGHVRYHAGKPSHWEGSAKLRHEARTEKYKQETKECIDGVCSVPAQTSGWTPELFDQKKELRNRVLRANREFKALSSPEMLADIREDCSELKSLVQNEFIVDDNDALADLDGFLSCLLNAGQKAVVRLMVEDV